MPWAVPERLGEAERKQLRAADREIVKARHAWARTVRELGISACARVYRTSPQALLRRVQRAERLK